jgi:Fe-Mn family superoxide dismutase
LHSIANRIRFTYGEPRPTIIGIHPTGTSMRADMPPLPYPLEALEPVISGATLRFHYLRHHCGYVDRLRGLVRDTDMAGAPLEAVLKWASQRATTDRKAVAIFNNAAQAWNHEFYWHSLRPPGRRGPSGALAARIARDFGSFERFTESLKSAATAHFGSGWAWVAMDRDKLRIITTSNADTPLIHGMAPILAIDLWEHAYYVDYQDRRATHIAGVVDELLNWEFAERNFKQACATPARAVASAASARA